VSPPQCPATQIQQMAQSQQNSTDDTFGHQTHINRNDFMPDKTRNEIKVRYRLPKTKATSDCLARGLVTNQRQTTITLCQAHSYLYSHEASLPFGQHQIILSGDGSHSFVNNLPE